MTAGFGYYGKIPARGDFLRRGIAPAFVEPWDRWIQSVLVAGRERLGPDWQDAYFSAPIWRFALTAGVCGSEAVIGVLMPSVDRVGRQFPFTIAAQTPAGSAWAAMEAAASAYPTLEEAALAMLEDDADRAALDAMLDPLGPGPGGTASHACRLGTALAVTVMTGTVADALAASLLERQLVRPTIWMSEIGGVRRLIVCEGLPGEEQVEALLDSSTVAWGPAAGALTEAGS